MATSGEWERFNYIGRPDGLRLVRTVGKPHENSKLICTCENSDDAALVASAPSILNALKACVEALQHDECWSTGPMHGDFRDHVCPGCAALDVARKAIDKAEYAYVAPNKKDNEPCPKP
jgi:hypothetical protein